MHILFVAMIMALLGCDTLPTHPHDDVHTMHAAIIEQHQLLSYPILDSNPPYFKEQEFENEKALAYLIADEAMYTVDRHYDTTRK